MIRHVVSGNRTWIFLETSEGFETLGWFVLPPGCLPDRLSALGCSFGAAQPPNASRG